MRFFSLVFIVFAAVAATVTIIIGEKYNLGKSWKIFLILELLWMIPFTAGILAFFIHLTGNLTLAFILSIAFGFSPTLRNIVRGSPNGSAYYRLSPKEIKGIVIDKNVYTTYFRSRWIREWVVLETADKQQIKTYVVNCNTNAERQRLQSLNIGDTGTLQYRRGRRRYYYEDFQSKSDESDDESN